MTLYMLRRMVPLGRRGFGSVRLASRRAVDPTSRGVAGFRSSRLLSTKAEEDDIDVDEVAYGYMGSKALFAALELGIFDHIAEGGGGATIETLQGRCGIEAPRLQTLVTALTALKALRRDGSTGEYTLSPNTESFLVSGAKHYYGDYLRYQVGSQFYGRMTALPGIMVGEDAPSYASWFREASEAETYSLAQHNGSTATGKMLSRLALRGDLGPELRTVVEAGRGTLLDVGGGTGAFSYVFAAQGLDATVLELPEVAATGRAFGGGDGVAPDVAKKVSFVDLDVTAPTWPVGDGRFDLVLMSYISGSVPEPALLDIYARARLALKPNGMLVVHDFMVDDALDGPRHAALWALQHVTVNAQGLGLTPAAVTARLESAGFAKIDPHAEMISGMTKVLVAHKAP